MRMKSSSISKRLTLGISLFLIVVFSLGSVMVFDTLEDALYKQVDDDLVRLASVISSEIEIDDGEIEHEWLEDLEIDPKRSKLDYIQVWDEQLNTSVRSPALGENDLRRFHGANGKPAFKSFTLPDREYKLRAIGIRLPVTKTRRNKPTISRPQILVLGHETPAIDKALYTLSIAIPIAVIISVTICILAVNWIIRSCLKPIKDLEQEIESIDASHPEAKLSTPENFPTELKRLAEQYSALLERIAAARLRERNFSAHAAHEMRTPLSGIHATLQLAMKRERSPDDYQQRIAETLEITSHMRNLVNRLMRFSQLQSGVAQIDKNPLFFDQLVSKELDLLSDEVEAKKLTVKQNLPSPCPVINSDSDLVNIIVSNLIGNAVRYSPKDSEICVNLVNDNSEAIKFTVENLAPELEDDDLEQLFDPFFRKDAARCTETGNFGLGLALIKEVTHTLGFSITSQIDDNKRFSITISIPT